MAVRGKVGFAGNLGVRHIRKPYPSVLSRFLTKYRKRFRKVLAAWNGGVVISSCLRARHYIAAEDQWIDLGVICRREVTDVFVEDLVDELTNNHDADFLTYKYHDSGTGVTAADQTDTGLETPCGEARDVGTQIEGATAEIFKTVATATYAGSFAITEHGLFNNAAGAKLLDHHVFAAINVVATDQIEFTYELTCTAGG